MVFKLTSKLSGQKIALNANQYAVRDFLPKKVASYVERWAAVCEPRDVKVCDGSAEESAHLLRNLEDDGVVKRLSKYQNSWLARTDPVDVARVESKTVISTANKSDTVATTASGAASKLGNWWPLDKLETELNSRFPGCMKGRTMYVVPFSMGPIGGPLSKIGIQLTDSPYVTASMRIMTRMGSKVLNELDNNEKQDFIGCMHSVGCPQPWTPKSGGVNWPCNPEKTLISHLPESNEIISFGSGYGGNSLLGKKCLALRMGSILGKREGWLAEHMLILGITGPSGKKRYIAAAFPSACGKTNLAMLQPTLPGYKVETVGDDIAWMRFDAEGQLRAINPEAGFFGVAPGTSTRTNAVAMETIKKDTVFTNVAETDDGGVYWEGLEKEVPESMGITDWKGQRWTRDSGRPSAHPNSRFCTPIQNCPTLDPAWHSSEGVVIDAILFGGRRPEGVPLVYEAFHWNHGVMIGATMKSETTAAAEHQGKAIMHDPFAMRPFFGYNFGHYLRHWIDFPSKAPNKNAKLPKIFAVNWFRKSDKGGFIWPGFGDNIRVLDWILRRVDEGDARNSKLAKASPIGYLPADGTLKLDGLDPAPDMDALMDISRKFWREEMNENMEYLKEQVHTDLPSEITEEMQNILKRLDS